MEKVSVIDNKTKTIKSPYLLIKFPYKSVNIESQMNNVFLIMSLSDATRNQEHIELLIQNLNKAFELCTSLEDFARVSYVLNQAIKKGGIAKEKESDIEKLLTEKERTMLSKMPKDSKVTCTIKEVEGIYSLYNSYQFIPGIKPNNDELKNKSTKYIQQLKFSDNLRNDKMFEKLKGSIRDVIHACINEQEFDEVEQMLSDLKEIGGIAVNIYPIASNMNKQAKEHFLEQKRKQEKKQKKQIDILSPRDGLPTKKQETSHSFIDTEIFSNKKNLQTILKEDMKKNPLFKPISKEQLEEMAEIIERTRPVEPIKQEEQYQTEEEQYQIEEEQRLKQKDEFDMSILEEYYRYKKEAKYIYEYANKRTYVDEIYHGISLCKRAYDELDRVRNKAPQDLIRREYYDIEEMLARLRRMALLAEEEEVSRKRNNKR